MLLLANVPQETSYMGGFARICQDVYAEAVL